MRVITIGGATQDIYLMHEASDMMTLMHKDSKIDYLLLRAGSKIEVNQIQRFVGGGATNSAASFKLLGFDASCFCAIGNDTTATFILEQLTALGIDTSIIIRTAEYPTGSSFIIKASNKERTIFAFRGANGSLQQDKIPYEKIKQSDQLYITSLSGNSAHVLPEIASFAYEHKIPVAFNPGMSQLTNDAKILLDVLPFVSTFILNYEEAKAFMLSLTQCDDAFRTAFTLSSNSRFCPIDLTEMPHGTFDDEPYLIDSPIVCENLSFSIRQFFKQMLKLGPRIIVVTNGSNGVYVATESEMFYHPSIKTNIVDTVGAGDSFGSCFVGSLLYKDSIVTALRNGIINSASELSVLGPKNGLLTRSQLSEKSKTMPDNLVRRFDL